MATVWYDPQVAAQGAWKQYDTHCGGRQVETETHVLQILREQYHSSHITSTNPNKNDFLAFAEAGNATAELERDNISHIIRSYSETTRDSKGANGNASTESIDKTKRLEHGNRIGVLRDTVKFGRYHYVENGLCPVVEDLLLATGEWTRQLHDEIWVFDAGMWTKNSELCKAVRGSSWDNVILDPATKDNLIDDIQGFFDSQALYNEFAVPWKRGIILHGLPGNGKTMSIRAMISYLDRRPKPIPSLYVKAFEAKGACLGPDDSIREIFSHARRTAPCLLIFEDLDSLVKDEIRSYFLNEVDGLDSNDGILMVGSTNHLAKLDPAIANRPSRFDRKYHFRLPEEPERLAYCEYWRNQVAKNPKVDFPPGLSQIFAQLTKGFSFAYLKDLFISSLLILARGGRVPDDKIVANDTKKGAEVSSKAEERKALVVSQVPDVEVPDDLRENALLKALRHQLRVLISEMDNTGPAK
ncbi:proteasome-activating nucleotidase [Viridothelium virens]|uniref:Proteasome-activating nucleotidase n=1 Tax=Viridothelium virens TaxID=1048519 RepID=A0A6A6GU75_VIRVR|nr:proteasome-activating nucleotidase [Viridothelium virens]